MESYLLKLFGQSSKSLVMVKDKNTFFFIQIVTISIQLVVLYI